MDTELLSSELSSPFDAYYAPEDSDFRRRGSFAHDSDTLYPLQNVGGIRLDSAGLDRFPFSRQAISLIGTDPLPPDTQYIEKTEPDSSQYRRHIRYLQECGVLISTTKEMARGFGKYIAVLKDGTYSRAIFDLRWTNERVVGEGVPFHVPSTQVLVRALVRLGDCAMNGFCFLHGDIRNCYYQIPISSGLGHACCIKHGPMICRPAVLPMGYKHACGIAQSIMWAIMLYEEEGDLDLNVDKTLYECTEAPGLISLSQGGFIALLYDSFLVVSCKQTVRDWYYRLERNFKLFNVVTKYMTLENRTCSFTYCGIKIIQSEGRAKWIPDPVIVKSWALAAGRMDIVSARKLYQFAGYLRHAYAILGVATRNLGRISKQQSILGEISDWSVPVDKPCRSLIQAGMCRVLSMNNKPRDWAMFSRLTYKKRVFYTAVDATTSRWAVWPMENGNICKDRLLEQSCDLPIALAEATAISQAITMATEHGYANMVIASDNLAASRAFDKGYSRVQSLGRGHQPA